MRSFLPTYQPASFSVFVGPALCWQSNPMFAGCIRCVWCSIGSCWQSLCARFELAGASLHTGYCPRARWFTGDDGEAWFDTAIHPIVAQSWTVSFPPGASFALMVCQTFQRFTTAQGLQHQLQKNSPSTDFWREPHCTHFFHQPYAPGEVKAAIQVLNKTSQGRLLNKAILKNGRTVHELL